MTDEGEWMSALGDIVAVTERNLVLASSASDRQGTFGTPRTAYSHNRTKELYRSLPTTNTLFAGNSTSSLLTATNRHQGGSLPSTSLETFRARTFHDVSNIPISARRSTTTVRTEHSRGPSSDGVELSNALLSPRYGPTTPSFATPVARVLAWNKVKPFASLDSIEPQVNTACAPSAQRPCQELEGTLPSTSTQHGEVTSTSARSSRSTKTQLAVKDLESRVVLLQNSVTELTQAFEKVGTSKDWASSKRPSRHPAARDLQLSARRGLGSLFTSLLRRHARQSHRALKRRLRAHARKYSHRQHLYKKNVKRVLQEVQRAVLALGQSGAPACPGLADGRGPAAGSLGALLLLCGYVARWRANPGGPALGSETERRLALVEGRLQHSAERLATQEAALEGVSAAMERVVAQAQERAQEAVTGWRVTLEEEWAARQGATLERVSTAISQIGARAQEGVEETVARWQRTLEKEWEARQGAALGPLEEGVVALAAEFTEVSRKAAELEAKNKVAQVECLEHTQQLAERVAAAEAQVAALTASGAQEAERSRRASEHADALTGRMEKLSGQVTRCSQLQQEAAAQAQAGLRAAQRETAGSVETMSGRLEEVEGLKARVDSVERLTWQLEDTSRQAAAAAQRHAELQQAVAGLATAQERGLGRAERVGERVGELAGQVAEVSRRSGEALRAAQTAVAAQQQGAERAEAAGERVGGLAEHVARLAQKQAVAAVAAEQLGTAQRQSLQHMDDLEQGLASVTNQARQLAQEHAETERATRYKVLSVAQGLAEVNGQRAYDQADLATLRRQVVGLAQAIQLHLQHTSRHHAPLPAPDRGAAGSRGARWGGCGSEPSEGASETSELWDTDQEALPPQDYVLDLIGGALSGFNRRRRRAALRSPGGTWWQAARQNACRAHEGATPHLPRPEPPKHRQLENQLSSWTEGEHGRGSRGHPRGHGGDEQDAGRVPRAGNSPTRRQQFQRKRAARLVERQHLRGSEHDARPALHDTHAAGGAVSEERPTSAEANAGYDDAHDERLALTAMTAEKDDADDRRPTPAETNAGGDDVDDERLDD
ncbi:hypothetical protein CYMTET_29127 [Cymbomonas tetramitiformis]|uniref:Uncharacterized protein n=1 Tax=Cymbomonas tetramitiformis TaxID=36881 RepID=A0AAE0FN36_9CHLO|nr:hypothetical protein CYMTET_29127 [Cymbomonas tetramitiformis]